MQNVTIYFTVWNERLAKWKANLARFLGKKRPRVAFQFQAAKRQTENKRRARTKRHQFSSATEIQNFFFFFPQPIL